MKKIVFTMALSLMLCITTAYGAPKYSDNVAEFLAELSIMQGDPDGNMRYDSLVSRAECTKIAVAASSYRNSVAIGAKTSPFKDVPYTHWSSPYVTVAIKNGLCTGYLDATFRPSNTVLFEEAATMFLRVLGYTNEDFGASWPDGQIGIAKNIGILDDIDKSAGEALTRRDVATMVYNTLNAKQKGAQTTYLSTFNRSIIDDVVLVSTTNEDASVAEGKIFTSSGTYNYDDTLALSNIGMRGSMVLRNNDTVVAFIPDNRNDGSDKQMVYSVLGNGIVTYKNGSFNQVDIKNDTVFYKNSSKVDALSALSSLKMGDVVRISYAKNGEIDYVMCTSGTTVGPKTVNSSDWYSAFGATSSLTVMRDGVKSEITDVKTNDIAYYLKELDIALVYSKKVTGIYESATPNTDTPTSITVSGNTYKLEGLGAFSKLSSNGTYKLGDTVTLLLGKDGDVADVASNSSSTSGVIGFLCGVGTKQTTVSGTSVTKNYVKITAPSGEVFEYITNKSYSSLINNIVSLTLKNGIATVSRMSEDSNTYGKFVWTDNSKKLGTTPLASDVKILEVSTTQSNESALYGAVYPQRLNSLTILESNVLYASKNALGEIDELILEDVTGDMYTYGIITSATSNSGEMSLSGRYSYICEGEEHSIVTQGKTYGVRSSQAVKIVNDGMSVSSISALGKVATSRISYINGSELKMGNTTYTMSDKVQIYIKNKNSSTYNMITIDELNDVCTNYSADVYTEKNRVRIIVLS